MRHIIGIVLFVIANYSFASPEIKGNPEELRSYFHPENRTLSIQGHAEKTAYTDEAVVNLVVKTENKLLSKAIKENSAIREQVIEQLSGKGFDKADIKNSKFSSSPQYGWFGSEPQSYEVVNRVAIKIADSRQLELIAEIADTNTAINFSGTTFEHSEKEAFEKLVKKLALEKVLEKKRFYEQSLGIKLTAVSFAESSVGFNATDGANMLVEEIVVMGMRGSKGDSYSKISAPSAPRSNTFDELEYSATVTVEFKVSE